MILTFFLHSSINAVPTDSINPACVLAMVTPSVLTYLENEAAPEGVAWQDSGSDLGLA